MQAEPLTGIDHPNPVAIPPMPSLPERPYILLLTEEDMYPLDALPAGIEIAGLATVDPVQPCAPNVTEFRQAALRNAAAKLSEQFGVAAKSIESWNAQELADWAKDYGVSDIVAPEAPVGFVAPRLKKLADDLAAHSVRLHLVRRRWDELCWPHARKGFFAFKEKIPSIIRDLNLL